MLLNLDGFKATDTQIAKDVLCITIESSFEPTSCLKCSSLFAKFYSHGTNKQFSHDAPVHGKPTLLKIYRKRFKCRECGGTFDEPLDIKQSGHTMASIRLKRSFSPFSRSISFNCSPITLKLSLRDLSAIL